MLQAIARMLGWKPPAAPEAAGDIVAAAPPGLALGALGMPAAVLDVEAMRARNRARLPDGPAGL